MNDWKKKLNIVYSTNPDFEYEQEETPEEDTLAKEKQALRILLDTKRRRGKAVTIVTGFVGQVDDLSELGKLLRVKCGVGGSVKDGEIIVQGDMRNRVVEILQKEGYKKTRVI
ncbi:MAG TPA: translation initiation factor [Dysgonamonadaceae bacterium]|nr:translation initiation factor [Dysgonamonadaceae bacterium]